MASDRHYAMAEKCGEISLNTFEQRNPDEFSEGCSDGGCIDAYATVHRGSIAKSFNVGLSSEQRKHLNVDQYNQGCTNPWGCVDGSGKRCSSGAAESAFGPFMHKRFDALSASFDASGSEYRPPSGALGWKAGSVNSNAGWQRLSNGQYLWEAASKIVGHCEHKSP